MVDLIIPQSKDFSFTVRIIEKDSFLPQDLTAMETNSFYLVVKSTDSKIANSYIGTVYGDPTEGKLLFTIPAADTAEFTVLRGPEEDGYYPKSSYKGIVSVNFDPVSGIPNRVAIIDNIAVVSTGV